TQGVKITLAQLQEAPLPCILHWNQSHFVVLYKIKKDKFYISDPVGEKYVLKKDELLKCWASTVTDGEQIGTALLLEPAPDFYTKEIDAEKNKKSIFFFFRYLKPFKSQIAQLFIGLLIGSILSLIFPFLTQSIVDKGIGNNNLSFVTLVLAAQLVLFCTQTAVNFLQNWLTLHINTRISISLISDFLAKLMCLPLRFFDSKNVGDIMQRIGDNDRIKSFLTGSNANFCLFWGQ
ncbi:MAG: peptidase domain-containing ABC transporter, partial [Prevotellaceae bacterium]|nr:peptidase domain-containing ABC transporter [Prevotellaceae bacterium]